MQWSQLKSASVRCEFCRSIPREIGTRTKINCIAKKTKNNYYWQL